MQNLSVGGLRVAEIDELVEQLVNDDEVVADRLLLNVLEVVAEDLKVRITKKDLIGKLHAEVILQNSTNCTVF